MSILHELAYGKRTEAVVGSLPYELARKIGCHPGIVYLRKHAFAKIAKGHSDDVRLSEFLQLPFLIERGTYYSEPKRANNQLTAFYNLPEGGRLYVAGIIWEDCGRELWIQTFFHIDPTKAKRRQSKAVLIYPIK